MCVYGSFDSQFVHLIKNIDRSKNVLAEADMIFVYILRSKRGGTPEIKNIDRSKNVLAEADMIYVYILSSKRGGTPEMLS